MNILQKLVNALYDRHWVHKGEMATHLTYLSATFLGAHGVASIAAGVLAVILVLGVVVSHALE